jgi:hypothetical protein
VEVHLKNLLLLISKKEVWIPSFNGDSVSWKTKDPLGFYAHEAAVELNKKVKYMNIRLNMLLETGYVSRRFKQSTYIDPRIHRFKQVTYWNQYKGKHNARKRSKRPCFYCYFPTEDGFLRLISEIGQSCLRINEDQQGQITARIVYKGYFV